MGSKIARISTAACSMMSIPPRANAVGYLYLNCKRDLEVSTASREVFLKNPIYFSKSLPYLAVTINDVLVARQFGQAAGPARMELIRADADLRSQAELVTVMKARAGVHQYRGRIDRGGETPCSRQIAGNNGVAVPRTVAVDMRDGSFEIIDNLDAENEIQVLCGEVF